MVMIYVMSEEDGECARQAQHIHIHADFVTQGQAGTKAAGDFSKAFALKFPGRLAKFVKKKKKKKKKRDQARNRYRPRRNRFQEEGPNRIFQLASGHISLYGPSI